MMSGKNKKDLTKNILNKAMELLTPFPQDILPIETALEKTFFFWVDGQCWVSRFFCYVIFLFILENPLNKTI